MAVKKKSKILYVDLVVNKGNFVSKFIGKKSTPDFSDVELVRKLLSNEKARILYAIKVKKPKSIYQLAKILKRDFKSVIEDTKILKRFEFIEFHSIKKGKRISLQPVLIADSIHLVISI